MIRNSSAKFILAILGAVVAAAMPAAAQSASGPDAASSSMVRVYDISKEIKVEGMIQRVVTDSASPLGTHVLVETASGVVDAHLGSGASAKPSYLGIAEGQNVTLVGMMETFNSNPVLVTRLLTTSNRIFVLRNEHGIPVRGIPGRSTLASQTQTQKGGL
jgi:hypothetical protein